MLKIFYIILLSGFCIAMFDLLKKSKRTSKRLENIAKATSEAIQNYEAEMAYAEEQNDYDLKALITSTTHIDNLHGWRKLNEFNRRNKKRN